MLTVEDGSGLSGAEAYVSVADTDAWLGARGYTLWATITETEKEQAVRRAADHLEQAYGRRWRGDVVSDAQALSWPRTGVVVNGYEIPSDVVPPVLVSANCLLAFKAASGELLEDTTRAVSRETIGPITTEYERGSAQGTRYRAIDAMLAPLLKAKGISLVRA